MNIFYSGDGGYGLHFKEIGFLYGPFDLTLMECGQYDDRWPDIHMLPIHWGAFTLAFHAWDEPVNRVLEIAGEKNVAVSTPKIGEPVEIGTSQYPISHWWK